MVWPPLKNIRLFPIYGKIKNVPNHQPVWFHLLRFFMMSWGCLPSASICLFNIYIYIYTYSYGKYPFSSIIDRKIILFNPILHGSFFSMAMSKNQRVIWRERDLRDPKISTWNCGFSAWTSANSAAEASAFVVFSLGYFGMNLFRHLKPTIGPSSIIILVALWIQLKY